MAFLECPECHDRVANLMAHRCMKKSQAKEPEASVGLCAIASHVVRVGAAGADQPATSEHMDVTAGETAPLPASQRGNVPDNKHALTGNRETRRKGRPLAGEVRDKPWEAAGMSKATYYRRKAEELSK